MAGVHIGTVQDKWPMLPPRAGTFKKAERMTVAGEIQHNAKKPGKTVPGVATYRNDAWRAEKVTKIKGFYGNTEERISCIDEYLATHAEIPLNKYNTLELDRIKEKPRYPIIEKNIQRWSPGGNNDKSPSPLSYKIENAYEKTQWPKQKDCIFNRKARISPFQEIEKR